MSTRSRGTSGRHAVVGEIDLIEEGGHVPCLITVKTGTSQDVKTAEATLGRHKGREVCRSRREYLRKLPLACQWRIDIVSVYYDVRNSRPSIEVFRGASWAA